MINVIVKQSHIMLKRNFCHCFQRVFYSNTAIAATEPKLKSLKSLAKSDRKRNKKFFNNNFIENLFLNKFEETILEYPEIETLKELTSLQKHCDLAKELLANCTNAEKSISERQSENVVSNLKNLELCGFKLPVQKGGYGFQISEHTFMQEVLSSDLALSKVIGENENLGIDIINLYGDQEQRDKYLPEVSKGESITCFAHIESNEAYTPLNPIAVNTKATLSSDGKRYIISGKKNWVYNASHANLIIFSAKVVSNLDKEEKNNTMLFLIDKNLNGIKIHKPIETMGLKGVDICDVTFNEVDIPINSVLGNISEGDVVIKKIFSLSSINSSVQCLTIMKKLLNTTLNHCLYNKFFNKYKYEQDYYKIVLGNIIAKIYAAESMTYLVTGRMDGFENADLFLESLILKVVKIYTITKSNFQHNNGRQFKSILLNIFSLTSS